VLKLVPVLAFFLLLSGWERVEERDGLTVERRVVSESRYHELRVSAVSPLSPDKLAASVWQFRKDGLEGKMIKRRDLLLDTPDERLVYQQVKTPIVSDRDLVVRLKRVFDRATGVHQILFNSDEPSGPSVADGHVRVHVIRGSWTFEPSAQGTIVTYACLSDPAGSLPAWIARGQQLEVAKTLLKEALANAAH
jgi:START domain